MHDQDTLPLRSEILGQERQLAVLEASPDAIVAVDDRGLITYSNPRAEEVFGYGREELIGAPVERLLPEGVGERHAAHRDGYFAHSAARPMGIGMDMAGRCKDGTEFAVEISLAPVEMLGRRVVFATVVDITARKAFEERLHESQKLESIGRVAGGIAHDFNNMLFAIRGHAEMLTNDLSGPVADLDIDDARLRALAIVAAADRATALTRQLLAVSRRQVLAPKVIGVAAAVQAMQPMLQPLIGPRIRLTLDAAAPSATALIDPSQFDQVLMNLVVNARDAMPDGGTITVGTESAVIDRMSGHPELTSGSYVVLIVRDSGTGIDATTRAHIFEPFFTTKAPGKGTGLGLATSYGIVRQAGGSLCLDTEVGRGSTFKVFLPRMDADEDLPPTAPLSLAAARR